ncbi:MAG: retroviral-like aspartic protease family protein [Thermoproteus sp.]
MGHIWVKVRLRNPWKGLEWEGEALIDTRATRTSIPTAVAKELGLEKIRDVEVTTAAGAAKAWLAYVEVELLGDRTIDRAVVLDGLEHVLIGVLTLESLDLKVDPRTGRLEKSKILVL